MSETGIPRIAVGVVSGAAQALVGVSAEAPKATVCIRVTGDTDGLASREYVDKKIEDEMDTITETDPTVPAWAKKPEKPEYTADEVGAQPKGDYALKSELPEVPVKSVNNQTGAVVLNAESVGADAAGKAAEEAGKALNEAKGYTDQQIAGIPTPDVSGQIGHHNEDGAAHPAIRELIAGLAARLNALADSDDTTLDQLSEIVAYIKSNKSLIDAVTTSKVSVGDIVNNLTTNAAGKPLSAAQGVVLKAMIEAIIVPTALSQLASDAAHRTVTDSEKAAWDAKSEFSGAYGDLTGKPTIPTVPTKVSAFENDAGYLTGVPEEYVTETELNAKGYLTQHQDISHKLDANKLPEAVDAALAQAKASGEFDGSDGTPATHSWSGTVLTISSGSGTSSADLKGAKGDKGDKPVKGTDYFTAADKAEMVEEVVDIYGGLTFDKFPTEAEINAMSNFDYFTTKGFHYKHDGLACTYQVSTSGGNFYVPYGNMYFRPVKVNADHRDILVDWYGIRRGTDYAVRNSEIMASLCSTLQNGYTLNFASGQYYFSEPIPYMNKHITFKGVCTNASVVVEAVNYGTYLHFPNLADGEAAINIAGGVVQDLGIIGNPKTCNVTIDRTQSVTNNSGVVTLVGGDAVTYGIKVGAWGYTIQNVRIRNCTYGVYGETTNALITNVDAHRCKIGVSVGNDVKVNNIQVFDVIVGVQLRGALASATNIRGDSVGKHLIECWNGKCMLSNIDGDYCFGSLIHYGDGTKKYIHLGQAVACMGRVAAKTAYSRSSSFDLSSVADDDYEYCSYISVAKYTEVFGGHIELTNVKANIMDSASDYVHPDAPISIGVGSTVKGVTIKCNIPYDADVEYFNKNVIKNLSTHAESQNDSNSYVTDFDGSTIEDINFITPIGFVRSRRTLGALNRELEFSKDANGAVLYSEQVLTEVEKAQARKNIGLDNVSSLEFVASVDYCTDSSKTYVLPDGRTFAYAEKPSYTNQLPIATDATGAIFNASDTPGYKNGYFSGQGTENSASNWFITGFIPVKIGQIVRLYNLRFFESDTNVLPGSNTKTQIFLFDETLNYVSNSSNYSPTMLPSAAWAAVYDETGNVKQFMIPTVYSDKTRYMRMCVRSITPDSVITVNEEMGPPIASFGETGLRFITDDLYTKLMALIN